MKIIINNEKLNNLIKKKLGLESVVIKTGYFEDVIHPINESTKNFLNAKSFDSISVAHLATILNEGFFNEKSQSYVAARPFMDNARNSAKENIIKIIKQSMKKQNPIEFIGGALKSEIQESIAFGNYQQNSAETLKYKSGKNPLIDEGFMSENIETRISSK